MEEIKTSISTYENCKNFIYTVCNEIYIHSGKVLSSPYIDIMHDDSIAVRWENDKRAGHGVFIWPSVGRYEGEWKDDCM